MRDTAIMLLLFRYSEICICPVLLPAKTRECALSAEAALSSRRQGLGSYYKYISVDEIERTLEVLQLKEGGRFASMFRVQAIVCNGGIAHRESYHRLVPRAKSGHAMKEGRFSVSR